MLGVTSTATSAIYLAGSAGDVANVTNAEAAISISVAAAAVYAAAAALQANHTGCQNALGLASFRLLDEHACICAVFVQAHSIWPGYICYFRH